MDPTYRDCTDCLGHYLYCDHAFAPRRPPGVCVVDAHASTGPNRAGIRSNFAKRQLVVEKLRIGCTHYGRILSLALY